MFRSLARKKTSEMNSNDCAYKKGQKIYYTLRYYQGVFGNRLLHMQFVQRTKDNVNICFTCSSTQTAILDYGIFRRGLAIFL